MSIVRESFATGVRRCVTHRCRQAQRRRRGGRWRAGSGDGVEDGAQRGLFGRCATRQADRCAESQRPSALSGSEIQCATDGRLRPPDRRRASRGGGAARAPTTARRSSPRPPTPPPAPRAPAVRSPRGLVGIGEQRQVIRPPCEGADRTQLVEGALDPRRAVGCGSPAPPTPRRITVPLPVIGEAVLVAELGRDRGVLQHGFDVATDLLEDRRIALGDHLHVRPFERFRQRDRSARPLRGGLPFDPRATGHATPHDQGADARNPFPRCAASTPRARRSRSLARIRHGLSLLAQKREGSTHGQVARRCEVPDALSDRARAASATSTDRIHLPSDNAHRPQTVERKHSSSSSPRSAARARARSTVASCRREA